MKKPTSLLLALTVIGIACPLLSGCGQQGTTSTMSKEEESHFKGGPMPPDVQKQMAAKQLEADQKRAGGGAAPGGPPPAAPSKP